MKKRRREKETNKNRRGSPRGLLATQTDRETSGERKQKRKVRPFPFPFAAMSGSNTPSREDGALSGGDQTPRASGDSSASMGGYGQQRPLPLAERDGADQPMWSLALTNLDPSLSDQELTDFFKAQPVGTGTGRGEGGRGGGGNATAPIALPLFL